jgi:hypothetical protein
MEAFCTCSRTSPFPISDGFVEALGQGKWPRLTMTVTVFVDERGRVLPCSQGWQPGLGPGH